MGQQIRRSRRKRKKKKRKEKKKKVKKRSAVGFLDGMCNGREMQRREKERMRVREGEEGFLVPTIFSVVVVCCTSSYASTRKAGALEFGRTGAEPWA
jgi:hypothetical protein